MPRTPIVAGNWKMHTTVPEALALVEVMRSALEPITTVERVVCPPFVALWPLHERLRGTSIRLGAQNVYSEEKGAYTGEISPLMLAGVVDYVIIGHSERRHLFGESDELIGRKVRAALAHGLQPILCVGETLAENEAGATEAVVRRQLESGLAEVESLEHVVLAYEPVWAIGTGRPATPEGANAVMGRLRELIAVRYGAAAAEAMRILYGGSVTPENFPSFMAMPEIDGGLVGGASLKADSFVALVRQAAATT